jgi:hypothetical protein
LGSSRKDEIERNEPNRYSYSGSFQSKPPEQGISLHDGTTSELISCEAAAE